MIDILIGLFIVASTGFVIGFTTGVRYADRDNEKLHDDVEWPRPDNEYYQEYHYNCESCEKTFWSPEAYFTDIECPDCR
jgi:hypothetical protein